MKTMTDMRLTLILTALECAEEYIENTPGQGSDGTMGLIKQAIRLIKSTMRGER